MREKGQTVSYDLLIAVLLFLLLMQTMQFLWTDSLQGNLDQQGIITMRELASNVSETLIKSQGFPREWNSANVETIGLAQRPSVLSVDKVREFGLIDHNQARILLALSQYDFFFELDSVLNELDVNVGNAVPDTGELAVVSRNVIYGGENANAKLYIFE